MRYKYYCPISLPLVTTMINFDGCDHISHRGSICGSNVQNQEVIRPTLCMLQLLHYWHICGSCDPSLAHWLGGEGIVPDILHSPRHASSPHTLTLVLGWSQDTRQEGSMSNFVGSIQQHLLIFSWQALPFWRKKMPRVVAPDPSSGSAAGAIWA